MVEWLSSWLAEQGAGEGSSPGLATSNFCIVFRGYGQHCVTNRYELIVPNINSIYVHKWYSHLCFAVDPKYVYKADNDRA